MNGYLMQMQPFSVNDGNGIRTTVFLAGCPLHCQWCANPEGLNQEKKVAYYEKLCIGCGACVEACPLDIGINLNAPENRSRCTGCGACVDACLKQARKRMVEYKSTEDIVAELRKHRLFYMKSGGGITFSGGEATLQKAFLDELSKELYDLGFSLALETCGLFDFDEMLPILERMDQIFMDLKHMDKEKHKLYTGVPNDKILENIAKLSKVQAEIIIRIPVIGSVNATEENIRASARFIHTHLPKAKIELLPYHRLGEGKYEALGLVPPEDTFLIPSEQEMQAFKDILQEEKIEIADFR